jgi:hypothetical protein
MPDKSRSSTSIFSVYSSVGFEDLCIKKESPFQAILFLIVFSGVQLIPVVISLVTVIIIICVIPFRIVY